MEQGVRARPYPDCCPTHGLKLAGVCWLETYSEYRQFTVPQTLPFPAYKSAVPKAAYISQQPLPPTGPSYPPSWLRELSR